MVSNIFYYHPYLGKIISNIFQRGWNSTILMVFVYLERWGIFMGYISFREGIARPPFSPSSSCYWWRGMPVQSFSFPWSWLTPWSLSWAFSSLWASSLIPSIRCAVFFLGGGGGCYLVLGMGFGWKQMDKKEEVTRYFLLPQDVLTCF